jgi:hypothetical protein
MHMSLEVCCCSSNLRFNLYCLLYSAFFCFLTASMLISAALVTRCACATLDSFCFLFIVWRHELGTVYVRWARSDVTKSVRCMCGEQGLTSRTRYGVCAVSKVIRNNRAVRHIHVNNRVGPVTDTCIIALREYALTGCVRRGLNSLNYILSGWPDTKALGVFRLQKIDAVSRYK